MQKKLKWITVKTGAVVYLNKSNFNRNRPYINHSEIKPCIQLEGSKAYPSGHTTIARVYARIMGAIYPERAVLFLKRSDEVAQNRVIGGVHHPSDIVAGKILGDAIAEDYLETDDFVNEFSVY
jgi:acid phosphatase (class A)